jgi:hypothetical protein
MANHANDAARALTLWRMSIAQHRVWLAAQKEGGYAAPVVALKSGKVIDPGRPACDKDGLTRH